MFFSATGYRCAGAVSKETKRTMSEPKIDFDRIEIIQYRSKTLNMASSESIIILDVHVEGMKDILHDMGWDARTVTELFGSTQDDRKDNNVITYAQNNDNCIVVTQDHGLIRRCRAIGIEVIGLEMDDLAKMVDQILRKGQ